MNSRMKIYIPEEDRGVGITKALKYITDDWVDGGFCSHQTIIDLRDAVKVLLKERATLKKALKDK